jgi:hypothetical protein
MGPSAVGELLAHHDRLATRDCLLVGCALLHGELDRPETFRPPADDVGRLQAEELDACAVPEDMGEVVADVLDEDGEGDLVEEGREEVDHLP